MTTEKLVRYWYEEITDESDEEVLGLLVELATGDGGGRVFLYETLGGATRGVMPGGRFDSSLMPKNFDLRTTTMWEVK